MGNRMVVLKKHRCPLKSGNFTTDINPKKMNSKCWKGISVLMPIAALFTIDKK